MRIVHFYYSGFIAEEEMIHLDDEFGPFSNHDVRRLKQKLLPKLPLASNQFQKGVSTFCLWILLKAAISTLSRFQMPQNRFLTSRHTRTA